MIAGPDFWKLRFQQDKTSVDTVLEASKYIYYRHRATFVIDKHCFQWRR